MNSFKELIDHDQIALITSLGDWDKSLKFKYWLNAKQEMLLIWNNSSNLFSDPLRDDVVGDDDDARPGHEPEGVEAEEGVVEAALLGVVLQGEERGVDEHAPACSA